MFSIHKTVASLLFNGLLATSFSASAHHAFIKGAALLSLTLWLAVGLAGRAIGFV